MLKRNGLFDARMNGRHTMQLSRDELLRAYRQMKIIREFEERLHVEIGRGQIPGFTHLYAGQEACAVGVCEQLSTEDRIISTHRGHGHCIAKGCDVKAMMAEIYGKGTGLCGGKGGSMHIADLDVGMLGANGIVGGGPPIAVGAAITARNKGKGHVVVSFGGDGSCNQGTVFEAMNLAVVLKVPAIFVFEDNKYSEHTHVNYAVGSGDLVARTKAFGMPVFTADGADFFDVHRAMGEACEHARNGKGPASLVLDICRFYGHVEGDPQRYRGEGEVDKLRKTKDCLVNFRKKVTKAELLDAKDLDKIDDEVLALIDEAAEAAVAAPPPAAETLLADVYNTY